MIQILNGFQILSSRTLITWDHTDDIKMEDYLGKFSGLIRTFYPHSQPTIFVLLIWSLFSFVKDMTSISLDKRR